MAFGQGLMLAWQPQATFLFRRRFSKRPGLFLLMPSLPHQRAGIKIDIHPILNSERLQVEPCDWDKGRVSPSPDAPVVFEECLREMVCPVVCPVL